MLRGTSRTKREQWADRLRRFDDSNQSVKAFCLAEDVSAASFYQWKRKLGAATRPGKPATKTTHSSAAFKAVRVVPTVGTNGVKVQIGSDVMIDLGCDAATIERVVDQLLRHSDR